jgi:alcohol dehydrogenase class IV
MSYRFYMPTTVECGAGISNKIGEILKSYQADRVFVVTDAGIRKIGWRQLRNR